jgi:hypothetical protein
VVIEVKVLDTYTSTMKKTRYYGQDGIERERGGFTDSSISIEYGERHRERDTERETHRERERERERAGFVIL